MSINLLFSPSTYSVAFQKTYLLNEHAEQRRRAVVSYAPPDMTASNGNGDAALHLYTRELFNLTPAPNPNPQEFSVERFRQLYHATVYHGEPLCLPENLSPKERFWHELAAHMQGVMLNNGKKATPELLALTLSDAIQAPHDTILAHIEVCARKFPTEFYLYQGEYHLMGRAFDRLQSARALCEDHMPQDGKPMGIKQLTKLLQEKERAGEIQPKKPISEGKVARVLRKNPRTFVDFGCNVFGLRPLKYENR